MYYWQYVKNGLIDQKLRTVQTIIHNQSWYFCLFSGNEGDFWIGAEKRHGRWYWLTDPDIPVSQSFWNSGEPNGSGTTCPCMWSSSGSRTRWDDQLCGEYHNYIFEKELY